MAQRFTGLLGTAPDDHTGAPLRAGGQNLQDDLTELYARPYGVGAMGPAGPSGPSGADGAVGPPGPAGAGSAFTPAIPLTTATIQAAMDAAAAAGGGTVPLPPQTIILSGPLTLRPNVIVAGSGWFPLAGSGQALLGGGTILQGDGTFDCFDYNAVDLGVPYSTGGALAASLLTGGGVCDLAMTNFMYGIKVGALYQGGVVHGFFSNLYATHCTAWGMWFENCSLFEAADDLRAIANYHGLGFFASGTNLYNFGNYTIRRPMGGGNTANGCGRGIAIQSRKSSQFNNVNVYDAMGSSYAVTSTQAATTIAPIATSISGAPTSVITCTQTFNAGDIVTFSAAVSPMATNTNYWVSATGLTGTTFQVSATNGGAPIVFSASGTPNVNVCRIGITDLSKVGVGMPVHFSAVNGFQSSQTYFVIAVSGPSGAGFIWVTAAIAGNVTGTSVARAPSGATAMNAIFNGWPGIECGGQDATSVFQFLTFTGNIDAEVNLSPHFVATGVQGLSVEFGIVSSTGHNDLAFTCCTNVMTFMQQANVTASLDALTQNNLLNFGNALVVGAGTGQTGFGLTVNGFTGVASLNLSQNNPNGVPDISLMPTLKQLQLANALALKHSQKATGATLVTGDGNIITYTSAVGTLTLPTLSNVNYVGWQYWVSNPGVGVLTINAAQNIVNAGASATSTTIPPLTNAIFVAHNNAGVMHWARY